MSAEEYDTGNLLDGFDDDILEEGCTFYDNQPDGVVSIDKTQVDDLLKSNDPDDIKTAEESQSTDIDSDAIKSPLNVGEDSSYDAIKSPLKVGEDSSYDDVASPLKVDDVSHFDVIKSPLNAGRDSPYGSVDSPLEKEPSDREFKSGEEISLSVNVQEPFQPGSTPLHWPERFMVWNSVGVIKTYDSELENCIDVEFHDASISHPLHVSNNCGYTIAALSNEAAVFACGIQEDNQTSKLSCMHFSSWDGYKEWSVEMPKHEDIIALGIGKGWIAIATDRNTLRLFTVGGFQFDIICLAGPVVCLTGHEDHLLVVYHSGLGLPGNQNLSLLHLSVLNRQFHSVTHVDLSPNTRLSWLGFSNEGSPITVDSDGVVRISDKHKMWIPLCCTKQNLSDKTDSYFVVGVSELHHHICCILCKDSDFPATIPRPIITLITYKLPFCDLSSEKGRLEENVRKHELSLNTLKKIVMEEEVEQVQDITVSYKSLLLKLFQLACQTDCEYRATEICDSMPSSQTIALAIKYAHKHGKMELAEKLEEVVQDKEEDGQFNDDELDRFTKESSCASSSQLSGPRFYQLKKRCSTLTMDSSQSSSKVLTDSQVLDQSVSASLDTTTNESRPFLLTSTPSQVFQNPFKKAKNAVEKPPKGFLSALDSMTYKKPSKTQKETKRTPKPKNGIEVKEEKKSKVHNKTCKSIQISEVFKSKSKLFDTKKWLEENREDLVLEFPDKDEEDIVKIAEERFKELSDDEKQKYKTTSRGVKRKSESVITDDPTTVSQSHLDQQPANQKSTIDSHVKYVNNKETDDDDVVPENTQETGKPKAENKSGIGVGNKKLHMDKVHQKLSAFAYKS